MNEFCSDLAQPPISGECILRSLQDELVFLRAYITNTLPDLNGQWDKYGAFGRPINAKHNYTDVREYHQLELNEHRDGTSHT